jgi:hypothetical protein
MAYGPPTMPCCRTVAINSRTCDLSRDATLPPGTSEYSQTDYPGEASCFRISGELRVRWVARCLLRTAEFGVARSTACYFTGLNGPTRDPSLAGLPSPKSPSAGRLARPGDEWPGTSLPARSPRRPAGAPTEPLPTPRVVVMRPAEAGHAGQDRSQLRGERSSRARRRSWSHRTLTCFGPTTPTRATRPFDASVDHTEARKAIVRAFGRSDRRTPLIAAPQPRPEAAASRRL